MLDIRQADFEFNLDKNGWGRGVNEIVIDTRRIGDYFLRSVLGCVDVV